MTTLQLKTSPALDSLYWCFENEQSLVPMNLSAQQEDLSINYLRTQFYTALARVGDIPVRELAERPTGLKPSFFTSCVEEIEGVIANHSELVQPCQVEPGEFQRWNEFFQNTIAASPVDYEGLLGLPLHIQVTLSAQLPAPPAGQLVRIDQENGRLLVNMVLGHFLFEEKDNKRYPLHEEWFHRGLQIGLMKHICSFERVVDVRNSLTLEAMPDTLLSQWYSDFLWFSLIQLFHEESERSRLFEKGLGNGMKFFDRISQYAKQSAVGWSLETIEHHLKYLMLHMVQEMEEYHVHQ